MITTTWSKVLMEIMHGMAWPNVTRTRPQEIGTNPSSSVSTTNHETSQFDAKKLRLCAAAITARNVRVGHYRRKNKRAGGKRRKWEGKEMRLR